MREEEDRWLPSASQLRAVAPDPAWSNRLRARCHAELEARPRPRPMHLVEAAAVVALFVYLSAVFRAASGG